MGLIQDPQGVGNGTASSFRSRETLVEEGPARYYENSLDHLQAELSLLELRLSRQIQRVRHQPGEFGEEFRGLLVSEEQIDSISPAWPVSQGDNDSSPDPMLPLIQQRQQEIADTCLESRGKGVSLGIPA